MATVKARVARQWSLLVLTNLALGVLGVVPIWLLHYLVRHSLLADMEWVEHNPTENDGWLPLVLVIVPVLSVHVVLWWTLNVQARRARRARTWTVAVLTTLLPTAGLIVVGATGN